MTTQNDSRSFTGQQLERLAHIEFLAFFMGKVSRKCIMSRFDVGLAAATRDLSLYNDIAPGNIIYDPRQKYYIPANVFECRFPLSAEKCLNTLSNGFGDYLDSNENFRVAHTFKLSHPKLNVTAPITRAISLKRPIEIEYISGTSGKSKKTISPFAVLDSGLRWHVRAYDHNKERFADFVINRIVTAKFLKNEATPSKGQPEEDSQWNEFVELIIQAHPGKPNLREVTEFEYGMENGILSLKIRKAYVGYLLSSWNIDSTANASLKGHQIFLHLKNSIEIRSLNVESFMFAPGSEPS